jgi:hypothetical protein
MASKLARSFSLVPRYAGSDPPSFWLGWRGKRGQIKGVMCKTGVTTKTKAAIKVLELVVYLVIVIRKKK